MKYDYQKGFTLTEVVILIGLFSIVLIGLLNIFDWQSKVYNLEHAEVMATGSARTAMNNMTIMLAQGTTLVNNRTISGTNYTSGGSSVIVQMPSYDSSGQVIQSTYDYVVYYTSGSNLYQLTELGTGSARDAGTKLLTDRLNSLAFTYNSGDFSQVSEVGINLTTRANYRGNNSVTTNLIETVFLRNK